MAPRTRYRSSVEEKGFRGSSGTVGGGGLVFSEVSSVSDQTGPGDCAPFWRSTTTVTGGRINRPDVDFHLSWFTNYRADIFDFLHLFDHLAVPESPSNVAVATEVAARTNPSRPYVDVVANILELADITDLIRRHGISEFDKIAKSSSYRGRSAKTAAKTVGSVNLLYQFGIAPLVGDLVKLCNFQDQFAKRVKEVKKLREATGFRKTIKIGVYNNSSTTNEVMQSQGKLVRTNCKKYTQEVVKGHIRWTTDEDPDHLLPDPELARLIRNSVVNLDLNAGALWEAMPWSWLIDWCANVGQYFKATRNVIPARLDGVHVIRHTKTTFSYDAMSDENWTISPAKLVLETKSRQPSFVAPVAHFPFLNGNQMGILASLSVTRR